MTNEETPIFERGDVVYGDDPFKSEEDARPWLILSNHDGRLKGPLQPCARCSPGGRATYWTRDLEEHLVARPAE